MSRTISNSNTIGITLTAQSDNPITVTSTGTISKSSGALGSLYAKGGATNTWTVDNFGVISGINGTTGAGGIYFGGFSSTVSSAKLINEATGTIGGHLYAVFANGPASITNVAGGTITANANAVMYLRGVSTVVNAGLIKDSLNTGVYLIAGGTVTNSGTITAPTIGIRLNGVSTVFNSGTITGTSTDAIFFGASSSSNALVLAPSSVLNGKVSMGAGKVELQAGGSGVNVLATTFASNGITNVGTIQFDSGASWKIKGNASSTGLGTVAITGFDSDDTIDLTGFVAVSETFASNALVLTNASSQNVTLHIQGAFATPSFQLSSDGAGGTNIVTCFAAGTEMSTPEGEVAVEDLRVGDLVTAQFAGPTPVRWIGSRCINCLHHPEPALVWPVCIAAHAFGPGRPRRDLLVSPNHGIYVDDVLVPARLLINGRTIRQGQADTVTYYHLELARHDLLSAEGLLSESYLNVGDRGVFDQTDQPQVLYPDLARRPSNVAWRWETQGCAPLVIAGERLTRAQRTVPAARPQAA